VTEPRSPVGGTARVLLGGTLASAVCFAIGFGLSFGGLAALGAVASTAGILVLLLTPAAGLVVTAAELRKAQPQAAMVAVGVLGVLALAVVIAFVAH
jgi:hypothetical protein